MIKKISEIKIYSDPWVTIYLNQHQHPDGSVNPYVWVKRKNGVGIAAFTKDQKILLNKEFRHVINKSTWEIPGGGTESGEDLQESARRELFEETGIKADKFEKMGEFYPINSFNTETITLFSALIEETPPSKAGLESDEEFKDQKFFPLTTALQMIDSGEITDACTALAIHLLFHKTKV